MGIAGLIISLLNIYSFILFARAIMSWFDPGFRSQIGQIVFNLTEPVVEPIRRVLPRTGGLDFSVMVAIFLVIILQRMLIQALY